MKFKLAALFKKNLPFNSEDDTLINTRSLTFHNSYALHRCAWLYFTVSLIVKPFEIKSSNRKMDNKIKFATQVTFYLLVLNKKKKSKIKTMQFFI